MDTAKSEAVISGMGGKFPGCLNVEDLKKKLFAGSNLLTTDEGRYMEGCKYIILEASETLLDVCDWLGLHW